MAAIPVPYVSGSGQNQVSLGHYATAQTSGAIAATPSALDVHASVRWAPTLSTALFVLMRLKLGWAVASAITTAVRMTYQASIARGFTVDYVTGSTALNLSTPVGTNTMRSRTMAQSQLGATGPRITTTGAMTGQTNTLDAAPFAIQTWQSLGSVTATGTAVLVSVGAAGTVLDLYQWTALGQHPVVCGNNEGVVVQLTHAGWGSGTVNLYDQPEWAEVFGF